MEEEISIKNSVLVQQLVDAIEDNLANHLPANAVFLAERLLAENDCDETRSILAECYMGENKHYKVYEILKHSKSETNRYKFALVCLKLNKFEDGEKALLQDHYMAQDISMHQKLKNQVLVDQVPNGCYGFYLLGMINEGKQKFSEAKEYFMKALELNPTLWVAYEKICKNGDSEIIPYKMFCENRYKQYQASKKFKLPLFNPSSQFIKMMKDSRNQDEYLDVFISNNNYYNIINLQSQDESSTLQPNKPRTNPSTLTHLKESVMQRTPTQQISKLGAISGSYQQSNIGVPRSDSSSRNNSAKRRKSSKIEAGSTLMSSIVSQTSSNTMGSLGLISGGVTSQQFQAPSFQGGQFDLLNSLKLPLHQQQQQQQQQQLNASSLNQGGQYMAGQQQFQPLGNNSSVMNSNSFNQAYMNQQTIPGADFLSFKSQANLTNNPNESLRGFNIYQHGNVANNTGNNNNNIQNSLVYQQGPHSSQQQQDGNQGIKDICTLLRRFGEAFYHMSLYLCKEAIEQFNNLPRNHYATGWVLTHIGRCYMEIVKYSEAEKYYAEALRLEPYRLEGIEYYSSCLWHLKKQVELCYLAQQALEKSLLAPETWIAVGNCFSLQKEHENALKFFQRAIQLNHNSAYAHSLCGHEFVYNEDFARARKSFQQALNFDQRNYNAWWGLGNIYYKQEKYTRAAEHFQKAININQKNPVLYSFMGMSLAADRKFKKALEFFESSEKLDPKNGLNKFQKANTLVKLENYDAALKELQELHLMMPKEAPIPMLMGKVYKKLKKTDMALKYFTDALDLENKDSQRIKALIESLHQDNHDFGEDLDL